MEDPMRRNSPGRNDSVRGPGTGRLGQVGQASRLSRKAQGLPHFLVTLQKSRRPNAIGWFTSIRDRRDASPTESLRPGRTRTARGFLLIECLVYIAALLVLLGLAFAAFYRVYKQNTYLERNAEDITRTMEAGELWREDIRQATGPMRWVQTPNGPELHVPHTDNEIAYVLLDDTVWRSAGEQRPWVEFLTRVAKSEMVKDSRHHVTAWRWEVQLQRAQKVARVKPVFSFLAVPATSAKP